MTNTITYAAIIPELSGGRGMALYQIVALSGKQEPTLEMKTEANLFGQTFHHIKDRIFFHNYESALSINWSKEFFRPSPEMSPRILKTSSKEDYPLVTQKLEEQYKKFNLDLITGEEAIIQFRILIEKLKTENTIFDISRRILVY